MGTSEGSGEGRAAKDLDRVTWVGPPCSRNAHDETVVVRRAQLGTKPGYPLEEVTSELGGMGKESPDHPSCSQNAHDETVLVRCAQ